MPRSSIKKLSGWKVKTWKDKAKGSYVHLMTGSDYENDVNGEYTKITVRTPI